MFPIWSELLATFLIFDTSVEMGEISGAKHGRLSTLSVHVLALRCITAFRNQNASKATGIESKFFHFYRPTSAWENYGRGDHCYAVALRCTPARSDALTDQQHRTSCSDRLALAGPLRWRNPRDVNPDCWEPHVWLDARRHSHAAGTR